MRTLLLVLLAACGHSATEPPVVKRAPTPPPESGPLVLIDGKGPELAAARAELVAAGIHVLDVSHFEQDFGALFFAYSDAKAPDALPRELVPRWDAAVAKCRPLQDACPELHDEPKCAERLTCLHREMPALREAWIRQLGAVEWVHVIAGPTYNKDGAFFAKAWGHAPCELGMRELRVGQESSIMMVGSAAPLPANLDAAAKTAGQLAKRIVMGEGEKIERALPSYVAAPKDDGELKQLLGCP